MRGFSYRALMKLAHRYNWHYMRPCYPEGDTMLWCHWCGIRIVTERKEDTKSITFIEAKNEQREN